MKSLTKLLTLKERPFPLTKEFAHPGKGLKWTLAWDRPSATVLDYFNMWRCRKLFTALYFPLPFFLHGGMAAR